MFLGPDLPIPLFGHGMVKYGTDQVVMGGFSCGSLSSSFYQLSVEDGLFKWEKMKLELKTPRRNFVAMTIPDNIFKVSGIEMSSDQHLKLGGISDFTW